LTFPKLDDASRDLDEARYKATEHTKSLHKQNNDFNKLQLDLSKRLHVLGLSDTSDDAVPQFQGSSEKKDRLDVAIGYLGLLQELDRLR
jgi:RAD50-interacting protein 1